MALEMALKGALGLEMGIKAGGREAGGWMQWGVRLEIALKAGGIKAGWGI